MKKNKNIYNKSIDEIYDDLKSNKKGLQEEEAIKRLKEYGENKLNIVPKRSSIKIFFKFYLEI